MKIPQKRSFKHIGDDNAIKEFRTVFQHLGREILACFPDSDAHEVAIKTTFEHKFPRFILLITKGKSITFAKAACKISNRDFSTWAYMVKEYYRLQNQDYSPMDDLIQVAREVKADQNLQIAEDKAAEKGNTEALIKILAYKDKREEDKKKEQGIVPADLSKKRGRRTNIKIENLNLLNTPTPETYQVADALDVSDDH